MMIAKISKRLFTKHNVLPLLFITMLKTANAQPAAHWQTVVFANDLWKFRVGNSEPQANWIDLDFEDSNWTEGRGGFGYGDNDDFTEIPATITLYLRIKFSIIDISQIKAAILHMDYDDAFIAYLNGEEIARSPGLSDERPGFDTVSTVSHEALMFDGGLPEEFSVPTEVLQSGDNLLAIEVHNQSFGSSDMSAIPFFSVALASEDKVYGETPAWFVEPVLFTSSNLPIIIIDTQGQTIVDEPKITARMGVIANDGKRNSIDDAFNEFDGWIGIELRGNASQHLFPKKPFTIETRHEDGSNDNVKLLGLPKENDWILRSAYIDKTFCRDALGYYMSRSLGRWAPRTRHVELILNGVYQGIYVLEESIKPDKNRLNITKMDSADISGEAVTGGYIWEVAQDGPDFGQRRRFKYPKPDDIMPEQAAYIRKYDDDFRRVMRRSSYNDPVSGFQAWIDTGAFIDEILVQEATGNSDAYGWSSHFYKDRGKKMCAGPVWDFDQALSNSTFNCGDCIEEWTIEKDNDAYPPFWKKLWFDPAFKETLANTWFDYRSGPLKTERLLAFVDSLANYLSEAQDRNFQKWPILGEEIWRSPAGARQRDTYQKEVEYMKDYLVEHMAWMDDELYYFTSVDDIQHGSQHASLQIQTFPNPTRGAASFQFSVDKPGDVAIKIYNILGRQVAELTQPFKQKGIHMLAWDGRDWFGESPATGLYFVELHINNKLAAKSKFLKL